MIGTALASMRFGTSVAFGRPFSMSALASIAAGVSRASAEFGSDTGDGDDLLMTMDPETQRMVQARRFRAQARRAARETCFYRDRLDGVDLRQAEGLADLLALVPTTSKADLQHDPMAFVRQRARPVHRTTTTGTTGPATTVWFSEREQYLIGVLTAVALSADGTLTPDDRVLGATSSRARLGMHGLTFAAQTIGASVHACGLLPPAEAVDLLCDGPQSSPTVLATYPSYLGALVSEAMAQGRRPDEFGLRSVLLGGEVLTEGLRERTREVFGEVELVESYGMTEIVPFAASMCEQGHLHYEPLVGVLEVLDLETASRPVGPGETGVIVATPLPPFRETTTLLRYVTEDVVTTLPGTPTCTRAQLPATSRPLGKRTSALRHDSGWLFARTVREALEAVRAVPLPARVRLERCGGGVAVEVVVDRDSRLVREEVSTALERAGVPLRRLHLATRAEDLSGPAAMRCDLVEATMRSAVPDRVRQVVGAAS